MNVRINQGYVITDSIHIGKAEFVIGEMSNTPAPFVTWECKDGNNYFWGHYLTTRKAAERDLLERAVQELEYQTRRQAEMEPQDSPWGEIQTRETLCPGAYSVSTAGHGGVMVRRELAEKVFRKEALNCGFTEGAYLCFEEDCDEPVALRELMDKGMYQAPVNEHFAPGAYEALINDSLQTFHAAYWQAREKTLAEKAQLPKKKDRGEAR